MTSAIQLRRSQVWNTISPSDAAKSIIMAPQQKSVLASTAFSSTRARAVVNRFLLSQVGNMLAAGTPELDSASQVWQVPILYNAPDFTGDEVGDAQVSATTGEIQQHTPISALRERAAKVHERHKAQIHTAFLRARKK